MVVLARDVLCCEVVGAKVDGPSLQARVEFVGVLKMQQWLVVGLENEASAVEVYAELLESPVYRQSFLLHSRVIFLGTTEYSGGVSDRGIFVRWLK